MRICMVLPWYVKDQIGGAELQAYYLAQEFLKRGWETYYICERRTEAPVENDSGIELICLPYRPKEVKWLNILPLKKALSLVRADIYYCRTPQLYPALLGYLLRNSKSKVIWAISRNSHANRPTLSDKSIPKSWLARFSNALFRNFIRYIDLAVAQNTYQKASLKKTYGLESVVLYNGHPLPENGIVPFRQRENLVLWVARIQSWKRPDLFLELAEFCKDMPIQFELIGPIVNKSVGSQILAACEKIPNVRYLGEMDVEKVNDKLSRAKLLVNTSEDEGFANTFIQSWLRGVPVLSFFLDPDGLIVKNRLGFVSHNLSHIKQAILPMLFDEKKWASYSDRCYKYSKHHFNVSTLADNLIKLFSNL